MPSTLWRRVLEATAGAMRTGSIQAIPTQHVFVREGGVSFLVRMVDALARKDQARRQKEEKAEDQSRVNPFLPYEADLFVSDLSETHLCLLNKFNVVEHHLLIVTRTFEDQEQLLKLQDFEALWRCMLEFEGLGFYNGGEAAGASQPHKHLQMVPLPLASDGPAIPMEPVLATTNLRDHGIGVVSVLPFVHRFARLNPALLGSPENAAQTSLAAYSDMMGALGLSSGDAADNGRQRRPYNLLVTRRWMLLVPRSMECFQGISINALGFAGALLVRNSQQLKALEVLGPMTALGHVGVAT